MVNQTEITELTCALVKVRSVTHDKEKCVEVLDMIKDFFKGMPNITFLDYECSGHKSLVVSYGTEDHLQHDIILSGHIDVVDGPASMFEPRLSENKIFGRGAMDMKGSVAAMMYAFKRHVKSGSGLSMALMITSDEEIAGFNGVGYLTGQVGHRGKCVIIPDGAGPELGLITGQKGIIWLETNDTGVSAHASRPEEGVNAIHKFFEKYYVVEKGIKAVEGTSINLSSIAGSGPAMNAVPDTCQAKIDIRSPEPNRVLPILDDAFGSEGYRLINAEPAYHVDENDDITKLFVQSIQEVTGAPIFKKPELGGSDARLFCKCDIFTIVCSVTGSDIHGEGEWVDAGSLVNLSNSLMHFFSHMEQHLLREDMQLG